MFCYSYLPPFGPLGFMPWGFFLWFMFDKSCYRVTLPTGGQNEEDKSNS